jgi:cell division protein FtsB
MRQGRRKIRARGCLLWLLALVVVLLALSLMFGGFQKGTKAGGAGAPAPVSVTAGLSR